MKKSSLSVLEIYLRNLKKTDYYYEKIDFCSPYI
jgi:hypothetical protein